MPFYFNIYAGPFDISGKFCYEKYPKDLQQQKNLGQTNKPQDHRRCVHQNYRSNGVQRKAYFSDPSKAVACQWYQSLKKNVPDWRTLLFQGLYKAQLFYGQTFRWTFVYINYLFFFSVIYNRKTLSVSILFLRKLLE